MSPRNPVPSPSFIRPLLPSLAAAPPEGWIHEIKHDGRTILVVQDGCGCAFTRNGHDWTERFGRIAVAAAALPYRAAILDGETIVQDERGISDIAALAASLAARSAHGKAARRTRPSGCGR